MSDFTDKTIVYRAALYNNCCRSLQLGMARKKHFGLLKNMSHKVKLSHYRPGQALSLRISEFLDIRHMTVVMLSALRTGLLYPLPKEIPPGSHIC
jgi:hypothetical protein